MKHPTRFYLPPDNIKNNKFFMEDRNTIKKIRQVVRLSEGNKIELFDGTGVKYEAIIKKLRKDFVHGEIFNKESEISDKPHLILAQALPKAKKLDTIVRMNTEVGVDEFIFFESEYSDVKIIDVKTKKIERLERIIIEASTQCERVTLPTIGKLVTFKELLNLETDMKIMLHSRDEEEVVDLSSLQDEFNNQKKIVLLIGPEGGFSDNEVKLARDMGAKIAKMNLPILRTQTAGVVASGILLS